MGTPQYGGTLVIRYNQDIGEWDPQNGPLAFGVEPWGEYLTSLDWTLNPSTFNYEYGYIPSQYVNGWLAQDWEMTDPSTYVVHLHQNIYWQNISPVNGRQFVASDVVFTYDRLCGLGDGFTQHATGTAGSAYWAPLLSVTATNNYTVVFKWGPGANAESITETLQSAGILQAIVAPEAVQTWGTLNNWHDQIGTGPFILTDYVSGSSETMVKNPNYWGYDERYPQNRLPYVNGLTVLIIPSNPTALAAVRAGKIDAMDGVSISDATNLQKTNPDITQLQVPWGSTPTVDPRVDLAPFSDIRVREAMQMAIDLPTIAKTYYQGLADPTPVSLTAPYETGYAWPYAEWPASLQAQYAYNPTQAKQLLAAAGYPNGFNTTFTCPNTVDLNLFEIVQSYFASVGINMSINAMDSASFTAFVQTNRSQTGLAARANGSLGTTSPPLLHITRLLITNSADYMNINDPAYNSLEAQANTASTIAGVQQIVQALDQEVAQQHFLICLPTPIQFAVCQPELKGYTGQDYAVTMSGSAGPQLLGFFGARFWLAN